jgi:hypothetical protein
MTRMKPKGRITALICAVWLTIAGTQPVTSIPKIEIGNYKPLLPTKSMTLFKRAYLCDDRDVGHWVGYEAYRNSFLPDSVLLDRNLNVIHTTPSNVSSQTFVDGQLINIWKSDENYYTPRICQINDKMFALSSTSFFYPEYGIILVDTVGKDLIYDFSGKLISSFETANVIDGVHPISEKLLLISKNRKCNIFDYQGNKLFDDLDDMDNLAIMSNKGVILTKDLLVNTNTKKIFRLSEIIETKNYAGFSMTDDAILYYRKYVAKEGSVNLHKCEVCTISFDGVIVQRKDFIIETFMYNVMGTIGDYLVICNIPTNIGLSFKLVCYSTERQKKLWEWEANDVESLSDFRDFRFFNDSGFRMTFSTRIGYLMFDLETGKLLKEHASPRRIEFQTHRNSLYADVPASIKNNTNKLVRIDGDLEVLNLGFESPSDFTSICGNKVVKVSVTVTKQNEYDVSWCLWDLNTSRLVKSSMLKFSNIFLPTKDHVCNAAKMLVFGLDRSISVLDFQSCEIKSVEHDYIDNNEKPRIYKVYCKVYDDRGYVIFSNLSVNSKQLFITVDVKSATISRTDMLKYAIDTIITAGEGFLVSDFTIELFDRHITRGIEGEPACIKGCMVYSYNNVSKSLQESDLGSGRQRILSKNILSKPVSVDQDKIYSRMGVFRKNGVYLQNYVCMDYSLQKRDEKCFINQDYQTLRKYMPCPVFTINKDKTGQINIKSDDVSFKYHIFSITFTGDAIPGMIEVTKLESNGSDGVLPVTATGSQKLCLYVFSNGVMDNRLSNPTVDRNTARPVFEGYPTSFEDLNSVVVTVWSK